MRFKLFCNLNRILVVNLFGAVIAFGKAYTLAIYYIYCWYYSHIIVLRSFLNFVRQLYCFFPGVFALRKKYLFLLPKFTGFCIQRLLKILLINFIIYYALITLTLIL